MIPLQIIETQGHATAALDHDEKGRLSPICPPSPWELMIAIALMPMAGFGCRLAELIEDRVRKTAEPPSEITINFWYKILSDESKDKLFRSVWFDGFSLVDKDGKRAPANDKNHWLCRISSDQLAEVV